MKKNILIIVFLLIISSLHSQTKFDDAVALNFSSNNPGYTGYFDSQNNLITAKVSTKDGNYILEIGKYDDNGKYSIMRSFELDNYSENFKMKFNSDGSRIAVLEKSPDRNILNIFDVNSGMLVDDFDVEQVEDFFLTANNKFLIVTGNNNTKIYDIAESEPILNFPGQFTFDMNNDGTQIFTKNGNQITYIDIATGNKLKTFEIKNANSVDFDDRGQLIMAAGGSNIRLYKLTTENVVCVKEINKSGLKPISSPTFEFFIYDDINTGIRNVYNRGGKLLYSAKIDPYNEAKTTFVFSNDEKRMAVINDKNTMVYDFDLIKYYKKIAQRNPELFLAKTQFETEQDQINRADRVKFQKQTLVTNVADEMKVSEGLIKQTQKNSLGLIDIKINSIGFYDPNSELYDVTLILPVDYFNNENVSTKIKIPKFEADIFTQNYRNFKCTGLRQLDKDLNGLDVFGILIYNDLNSTTYKALMHRTLPVMRLSYDEQFEAGKTAFESRNWYDAILNLTDFPEDYKKNSVVDYMLSQSITNFFDDKWSYVQSLNPVRDSTKLLIYLSDFPSTFKLYTDVVNLRQTVVNSIMESRLDKANSYISDKMYSDALDYINSSVTPTYSDLYSGKDINYEYYNAKLIPIRNNLLVIIAKRSMEGGNFSRAIELLNQVTKDYPEYSEVERLLGEAKSK